MKRTKNPDFPPVLETPRLFLRPIRMSDAADIFDYASDPEVARYMSWDCHTSLSDTQAYIEFTTDAYRTGGHYDYAFESKETGRVIGAGGAFKDIAEGDTCAEIGYVLNRDFWGRGLVPEAMRVFVDYLFAVKNIHRVEAYHFLENEKSGRVMQKLGMTHEGTLVDKQYLKGRFITTKVYAVINPAHLRQEG